MPKRSLEEKFTDFLINDFTHLRVKVAGIDAQIKLVIVLLLAMIGGVVALLVR